MGKAEFGTPKYFANRMKAKGLQKLKFYCQVCSKQCRDANGFKAHVLSPSHNRNIQQLGNSRHEIESKIRGYSDRFEQDFLRLLRLTHGTKKVNANRFYQEYIAHDRDHVHLNATRFSSLAGFVMHLERTKKIEIAKEAGANSDEVSIDNYYGEGVELPKEDDFNMQNFMIRIPGETEKVLGGASSNQKASQKHEKSEEQLKMEMIRKQMELDKERLSVAQEAGKTTGGFDNDKHGSGKHENDKVTDSVDSCPVKFTLKKKGKTDANAAQRASLGFKVGKKNSKLVSNKLK